MEFFQNLFLPFTVAAVLVFGLIKKVPVFSCFISGAGEALKITADILPAITALMLAVSMLGASGVTGLLSRLLAPAARLIGLPEELLPLCLMCPVSGSGAMAMLEELLGRFGADSYIGRTASVICGASETTFYAIAVYFGSVGITKTRHTLPSALIADFISYLAAALVCRII